MKHKSLIAHFTVLTALCASFILGARMIGEQGMYLALAAVPMGILSWIVYPVVARDFGSDPLTSSVTRIVLLTIGLAWLLVLSLLIVRREEGDLRWETVKRRLRLHATKPIW